MRTIKFRGKRIDNGEWVYGYYTALPTMSGKTRHQIKTPKDDHSDQYEVHHETVGQFTGLLDKNGKEIFEGDVCRRRNYSSTNPSDNKEQIGVIEYSTNIACFIFQSGRRYSNLDATMGNDEGAFDERLTVTGNIHETSPA